MDCEVEKEVVTQIERAGNVDDIANSFTNLFLDVWSCNADVIEYEILSRLTVKALMRFKCVSKRWRWLIENDPNFIKLQFTRSKKRPVFFYVIPLLKKPRRIGYRGFDELLLTTAYLPYQGRGQNALEIHTIRKTDLFCCDEFLSSNGLICFIDHNFDFEEDEDDDEAVCVYNVSTREVTPWMESTILIEEQEKHPDCNVRIFRHWGFGFDPSTMEHKIICILTFGLEKSDGDGIHTHYRVCEVLTVGENTWRRIDQVPPFNASMYWAYACVSGSIYWMTAYLYRGEWQKDLGHIVAFDIGSEKFRTISFPICIVDKPLNLPGKGFRYAFDRAFVLDVNGRVAILRRMDSQFVKIRIFNDECSLYNKEIGNKITIRAEEKSWTEDTIKMPFIWDREDHFVEFYSVPGTDQIIMESYIKSSRNMNDVSLYSYSYTKKSLMEIKVNGIPSSVSEGGCTRLFVPLVENIIPVGKKITRTTEELHPDTIEKVLNSIDAN